MRGNTAQRLRLILQGGCSTPRLIPPGRAVSRPAPPTRALLRLPGAVAFSWRQRALRKGAFGAPFPAIPSTRLPPLLAEACSARRRCKGEIPLSPLDTPFARLWTVNRGNHATGRRSFHRSRQEQMLLSPPSLFPPSDIGRPTWRLNISAPCLPSSIDYPPPPSSHDSVRRSTD